MPLKNSTSPSPSRSLARSVLTSTRIGVSSRVANTSLIPIGALFVGACDAVLVAPRSAPLPAGLPFDVTVPVSDSSSSPDCALLFCPLAASSCSAFKACSCAIFARNAASSWACCCAANPASLALLIPVASNVSSGGISGSSALNCSALGSSPRVSSPALPGTKGRMVGTARLPSAWA